MGFPCLSRATTLTSTNSVSTLILKFPCAELEADCEAGFCAATVESKKAGMSVTAIIRCKPEKCDFKYIVFIRISRPFSELMQTCACAEPDMYQGMTLVVPSSLQAAFTNKKIFGL